MFSKGWKFLFTVALGIAVRGAEPALIPMPREVKLAGGEVSFAGVAAQDGGFAAEEAKRIFGVAKPALPLRLKRDAAMPGGDEAYTLAVRTDGVEIAARSETALFYGVMTLRQLAQRGGDGLWRAPVCEIKDAPAFAWRGFMHDVGRNPQDVELLKRFIEVMAQYKMNVFHFHLTDYPGWRVECRSHPELNDPKFQTPTRRPGFFYSYAQINELIAFCAARGITVVPELDMPGHSTYFKNAFGFDMQDPRGMKILEEVLAEFMDNVKTDYLHIGSDEVQLRNPKFLDHMADFVRARGRKVLVWRPGGMPKGEVITQLWSAGGKRDTPLKGIGCVDSRHNYINHMDPFDGPLRMMNLAPCDRTAGDATALGGILCHWPDNNVGDQMNVYRQSPVFPALLAAAEVYWRGGTTNRPEAFAKLPPAADADAQRFADFERRMLVHRDTYFRDWPFQYVKQTDIPWKLIGPFDHGGDAAKSFPVETELRDTYDIGGKTWTWTPARGATIHVNHFFGYDAWLPKTKQGTAYALTYVNSPSNQTVGFWIGFNGPSRSSRREPGSPAGEWSASSAKVWVNDHEVPPPAWKQPGLFKGAEEVPFVDEDCFYRAPTPVALSKGWNKILIRVPKAGAAWKWMFTCVPVRENGVTVREADDLKFAIEPTK